MSNPLAHGMHTPGPWGNPHAPCEIIAHGKLIAVASFLGVNDIFERNANARLIAAAPELLAACEAMSAHYSGSLDHQPPYVALARAAIAKAQP